MATIADLKGKRIYLDANVFIYALDNLPPWNVLSAELLHGAEAGVIAAITSELTLAECLVKPYQTRSQQAVSIYEQTIRPRSWLTIMPVSRVVLIETARIRAASTAKLPDAIHVASFHLQRADVFITNDQPLKSVLGNSCCLLSELTTS